LAIGHGADRSSFLRRAGGDPIYRETSFPNSNGCNSFRQKSSSTGCGDDEKPREKRWENRGISSSADKRPQPRSDRAMPRAPETGIGHQNSFTEKGGRSTLPVEHAKDIGVVVGPYANLLPYCFFFGLRRGL